MARLVRACSEKDLDKAEKYAAMLPEVDSGDVDVQELETFTPQVCMYVRTYECDE